MNTLTVIMADEPADAWAYALKAGVPDRPFFSSQWPEIDGGMPVSDAVLLARVDQWIAMLPERSVHVAEHEAVIGFDSRRESMVRITPAMKVDCPECVAKAGQRCVGWDGMIQRPYTKRRVHDSRARRARRLKAAA